MRRRSLEPQIFLPVHPCRTELQLPLGTCSQDSSHSWPRDGFPLAQSSEPTAASLPACVSFWPGLQNKSCFLSLILTLALKCFPGVILLLTMVNRLSIFLFYSLSKQFSKNLFLALHNPDRCKQPHLTCLSLTSRRQIPPALRCFSDSPLNHYKQQRVLTHQWIHMSPKSSLVPQTHRFLVQERGFFFPYATSSYMVRFWRIGTSLWLSTNPCLSCSDFSPFQPVRHKFPYPIPSRHRFVDHYVSS